MREQVEAGGLMSYGGSLVGVARRVAGYVDKLFKGAKAADLPVEQPTTLELAATSSERRVCTTRRGRRGPIEYLYLNATALDTRWAARSKTLRP
jgi:hypothetical protein